MKIFPQQAQNASKIVWTSIASASIASVIANSYEGSLLAAAMGAIAGLSALALRIAPSKGCLGSLLKISAQVVGAGSSGLGAEFILRMREAAGSKLKGMDACYSSGWAVLGAGLVVFSFAVAKKQCPEMCVAAGIASAAILLGVPMNIPSALFIGSAAGLSAVLISC